MVIDQSAPRMAGLLFFQDELIPQLRDELNFKNVACTALKKYKMHRYGTLFGLVYSHLLLLNNCLVATAEHAN